jgi:hypothetical protein
MLVLDENIDRKERQKLVDWRIQARMIGEDLGRRGMTDQDVIPLLHRLKVITYFTADVDYYKPRLCHPRYCLVWLDVDVPRTAEFVRLFLRHQTFKTWRQRTGAVVRAHPKGLRVWRWNKQSPDEIAW